MSRIKTAASLLSYMFYVHQLVQLGMHSSSSLTSYLIDKPANLTAELHLAYL